MSSSLLIWLYFSFLSAVELTPVVYGRRQIGMTVSTKVREGKFGMSSPRTYKAV